MVGNLEQVSQVHALAMPEASTVSGFDRQVAGTPFGPGPVIHADIIIADKAKPQR